MVTTIGNVDRHEIRDSKEAMLLLNSLHEHSDMTVDELCQTVSLSGLSILDTVRVYSAFSYEKEQKNVVSFERRNGKPTGKKIQRQLAREVAYEKVS